MNEKVKIIIDEAVKNMINHTGGEKTIKKFTKKHDAKIHFIPKKYRVFGGMMQSMNIKFGNFIEELMSVMIQKNEKYEIIDKYSGKKSNKFKISASNEALIDSYITKCQTENINLETEFSCLMNKIINDKDHQFKNFKHDIDLLFKDKETDVYYYLEIKYNDDHDTGKFVDISRKLIKTSAYLINELNITELEKFKPISFFFNNKKMKENIYIPENTNIYRGKKFFDEFLDIEYAEVEKYMTNLSESKETIEAFNELYERVINYDNKS